MNSRISLVLKTKNISSAQLADDLGVQRSGISHILNGRNKPSLDFILRIIKKYPDISINWLLFGEGPMMNPYPIVPTSEISSKMSNQKSMLELFSDVTGQSTDIFTPDSSEPSRHAGLSNEYQLLNNNLINDQKNDQKNGTQAVNSIGNNPDIELNQDTQPLHSATEHNSKQHQEYANKPGLEKTVTNPSHGKRIDKVIIFYNDRSFKEYYPEE